ncbi:MAG: DEAD/DEAH box helicase [Lentisphaeria bacterium]|nr:DEAD/DEAH box helicase [Lentisphaeria bacterium]
MAAFEERLNMLAGADAVKTAKQLLKGKRLYGAWYERSGRLCAMFRDLDNQHVECSIDLLKVEDCRCSRCGRGQLCAHGAALVMYAGKFRVFDAPAESDPNYYGGLKKQDLTQLAGRGMNCTAKLFINVASAAPHAPSKWENMILQVRLKTANREYTGNQSNLRQLYFDKSLSVVLKFDDFSLHEQQLIRFLALNGEADNSNITLNAEQTAEFFHALPGFPRFLRDGRHITVHPDRAEPVLIESKGKVLPGLQINGAVLPFSGARVIAGKAGCWIGRDDEYFFVGGCCETGFLRNFFRAVPQLDKGFENFPLPRVRGTDFEPTLRTGSPFLDGVWNPDEEAVFQLNVNYLYGVQRNCALYAPGSGALCTDGGRFWKRDRDFERRFENELALFGVDLSDDGATARFADLESAALFLDRALPEIIARHPETILASRLAKLLRGAGKLPEITLHCELDKTKADAFVISYSLQLDDRQISWVNCQDECKKMGIFLEDSGVPGKIPPALGVFMRAVPHVIRKLDPNARTFELPFCNVEYFNALVKDLPGAVMPGLTALLFNKDGQLPPGEGFTFNGELRPYQQEGVAFMQKLTDGNLNVLLADEMGLGKTVQLLALLASRLRKNGDPALIVCPASLVANWEREAAQFVPELKVSAPQGNSARSKTISSGKYNLLILSYAAARLAVKELKKIDFSYLVLDEAQHIKNPGSGNAKNCKDLNAAHRIVLTGTPLENSSEDLWSVMDFLQPGMLGTLPAFRKRYAGIADSTELQQDLVMRTSPFIMRRTKKEVASDLPSRFEHIMWCDFTPEQKELYDKILAEGKERIFEQAGDERKYGAELFATLLRLRQVCCHPELLPDNLGEGIPSAKTELLAELLAETIDSGHKVLLFSQFTSMLQLLIKEVEAMGIKYEYLDGSTRNRQQHIDNFNNDPSIQLFLLSLKAGGTGLNLTSADTVVIYDPWWNPAAELQAADRSHRIGQTRPVSIGRLVMRHSIEEKILRLQARKRELFFNLVENQSSVSGLSLDDLKALLN